MTGEPKSDDEPDFLDDFILEEETPAKEDLDTLFEAPAARSTPSEALGTKPAGKAGTDAGAAEDDLLFTDHTPGLQPSARFDSDKVFSETGSSTWRGEALELDEPGVPVDDEQGTGIERGAPAAATNGAEATFAAELDSLLQGEDEFALETDQELQIDEAGDSLLDDDVDGDTFVLDDGAGTWQEAQVAERQEPQESAAEAPGEAEAEAEAADAAEAMPLEVVAENGEVEPGWEPLPGTSMDELAEADVARVDGEAGEEAAAGDEGAVVLRPVAMPREVDAGQEIYAEATLEEPVAVVGGRPKTRRVLRLVASLAASLAIVATGVLLLWRPAWFGLREQPEQVQSVQVTRPRIEVAVATPPMPLPEPGTATTPPTTPEPTGGPPAVVTGEPEPPTVPVDPPITAPEPPKVPPSAGTSSVVTVPAPNGNWPVPVASPADPAKPAPDKRDGLVRVGEDLLVGEQVEGQSRVVDGMLPGSKAFAQLHNGNYFIGSVKFADVSRITLRVASGEITLERSAIAKLTELGSADYEQLQKVTSGFVRLTNNNRIIGSILSSISDDHIVIESRSNRVMLPKSAIGEVVQGGGDGAVRLGTTRAEDDWLHQLSERQMGSAGNDPQRHTAAPPATQRSSK